MASAVLFGVCALCLIQSLLFRRDFFGPVSVYLFSQCFTLGVSWLRIMPQMTDWRPETWAVFCGSAVCFAAGCVCARLSWAARHPAEKIGSSAPSKELLEETNRGYDWTLHMVLTAACFLFFCCGVAAEIAKLGTLIAFSPRISELMTIKGAPDLGLWAYPRSSYPLVCMLCAVGCFRSLNPRRGLRIAFRILFAATLVPGFLAIPNRLSLFATIVTTAYLFNLAAKRIRPTAILLGIAAVFALFVAAANLKGQTIVVKALGEKKTWELPYSYFANNWWNLDYAVNRRNDEAVQPPLLGLDAVHGTFELLPVANRIYPAYGWDGIFNEHSVKVKNLNTMPYQWGLYKDFGIAGCFAGPFLFGLLFGTLYALVRSRGTVLQLLLYAHLLFYATFWFYDEFWSSAMHVAWIAVSILVPFACARRGRAKSAAELPGQAA